MHIENYQETPKIIMRGHKGTRHIQTLSNTLSILHDEEECEKITRLVNSHLCLRLLEANDS